MKERAPHEKAIVLSGVVDKYHAPSPDNDAARRLSALLRDHPEPLPCAQRNPDLWISRSPAARELARNICSSCPVREECPSAGVTINGQDAERTWTEGGKVRRISPFRSDA